MVRIYEGKLNNKATYVQTLLQPDGQQSYSMHLEGYMHCSRI